MRRALVVVGFLLSSIVPVAPAQVSADADLAVVSVNPGNPVVGAPREIAATVKNNGPTALITFNVVFYWGDLEHPVAGTVEDSRATHQGLVPANGVVTVPLEWTPRAAHAGTGTLIAVAEVPSSYTDPRPENDQAQATGFVTRPGIAAVPSWTERQVLVVPGAEHPLPFDVTNTGNVPGTFVAQLDEPEVEGWTFRLAPESADLLPGERRTFVLTIQPPVNAPALAAVNESNGLALSVVEEGFEDSDVGLEEVLTPDVGVAPQRALAVAASAVEPGLPGTTLVSTITLENDGNQDEEIRLTRSTTQGTVPRWWTVTFANDEVDVDAFGTATTTLSVPLPTNATAGTYELALIATAAGGALPPVARATLALTVQQVHRLEVVPDATSLELLADEPGTFVFSVKNTGNGDDEITLSAESPADGWEVTPLPSTALLGPGDEIDLTLRTRAVAGTSAGTTRTFRALVATQGGEDRAEQAIDLTVAVKAGANLHLVTTPQDPKMDPARGLSLPLQVVNGGNRRGNATIDVEIAPPWQAFTNADEARLLGVLARRSFTVTITAPEGALPGEDADLTLTIVNDGGEPRYESTVRIVVGGPDLAVRVKSAASRAEAGDEVPITIALDSRGLKSAPPVKVVLTAQGNRGTRTLATWDIAALPTGSSADRTTQWNTSGWAGAVLLTAQVDPDNTIAEEDEGNNEATHSLFATIVEVGLQVPPALTADPGQRVALATPPLAVTVTNRGNDRAEFLVRILDEGGWVDIEDDVQLAAGAGKTVPLTFDVPRPTGRLVNNFTVHVSQRGHASGQATWTLNVRDVAAPRADGIASDAPARWGVPGVHRILWDDGTGVRGGHVHIIGPNGTEQDAPVTLSSGTPRFTWTPDDLGAHELIITLVDLAGNTAPSLPTSILVGPPDPLTISVQDDARVRPGALLPVTIRSPAPLDEVTVLALGLRTQIAPPYRINTTGWDEGKLRVEISATDKLGRSATHAFDVIVDATRPTLTASSAEPRRAKAGHEIVATLTFDEDLSRAAIVLVGSDGLRTKHDALELGGATWEARFQLPSGRVTRTDVQATDLAGNDAVVEGGLDLKTENGTPGPALVLLVLAVTMGAILRRRRS